MRRRLDEVGGELGLFSHGSTRPVGVGAPNGGHAAGGGGVRDRQPVASSCPPAWVVCSVAAWQPGTAPGIFIRS